MNKKHVLILAISVVMCFSFGTAQAATTISLEPASADVILGDQIFIDVVFLSDISIGAGSFDFTYDTAFVTLADFSINPVAAPDSIAPNTATAGQINDAGFGNFFGGLAVGSNVTLATMTFDTIDVGLADFTIDIDPIANGGWFNGDFSAQITDFGDFTLNNASVNINPVPIPSTLLILGSGLVGLVGIGRKKRN